MCAEIGSSGRPISRSAKTSWTKCRAVTSSSPLHAAVALTSPKPSTPSSVVTRTTTNDDASCTTRAPRTRNPGFARAVTTVVSTAAIATPASAPTVGDLFEAPGERTDAGVERRPPALGRRLVRAIGEPVELAPAAGLGDHEPARPLSRLAARRRAGPVEA